ncbi:g6149 [Coccomyxa elongata]
MVPGPAWRCFLVLAVAAVGSLAQGLEADWASMQPLYQEGLSANWPSVVASAPSSSGGVRNVDPWAYGNLYPDMNVTAGTAVHFAWQNMAEGVSQIPSRMCPQAFNGSDIMQLAPVTAGGDYTTPPLDPGDYFYASPVFGHCLGGMMQAVHVAGQAAGLG